MPKKVLVVDDEKNIVKGLKFSLRQDDMEVDAAYDGQEALDKVRDNDYDIVLLDVMLPVIDGFDVCQQIREFSDIPIVMVSARGDDMDKILGLDNGADDYITKPFNVLEVKARLKAILRRSENKAGRRGKNRSIEIGGLSMDLENRMIRINGRAISLTAKEFDVLELLSRNPGKVYSRTDLLNLIWGRDYPGDERTVDVHIRRLREKIEDIPGTPRYVHTKWGVGYYFQAP